MGKKTEVTVMKIHDETGIHYKTIYTAIDVLKRAGFIVENYDPGPPLRRLIKLTEKGRKAAEAAKTILELAGEM